MTIVAVKLSMMADNAKAKAQIIQRSERFFLVLIIFLIAPNPSKWSIISTIAIAPIKKISISAVFPIWCSSVTSRRFFFASKVKLRISDKVPDCGSNQLEKESSPSAIVAQQILIINKAGISLSNLVTRSSAIAMYPIKKTRIIKLSMASYRLN